MAAITSAIGRSGRRYVVEKILQESRGPYGPVYLASADNKRYVLKDVGSQAFKHLDHMYNDFRASTYVRVAEDAIPDHTMFAFRYFKDHLLSFAGKAVPESQVKRILRDSLRGLAAMHEKRFVHGDVKPNNIVIDYDGEGGEGGKCTVTQVQLADIEDAAYVPEGKAIEGWTAGNWMWRSPEAHAARKLCEESDMFSFGLVCIYAMTRRILMAVDDKELFVTHEGQKVEIEKLAVVIERQMSYFAPDLDSIEGFMAYLGGDHPWAPIFTVTVEGFGKDNPRKPLTLWTGIEEDFRDLLAKLTDLNPLNRIGSKEALEHPWWKDVPDD
ncbi:kinase-like protein [Westerdykella ornata]|uniref:Kinase-like protein n=1 Tax=Westerdykella ornata TaxID=318751 RepID=A0A6A6J8T9_WESOR|nr:kinase-like protein [Westerdykella ornata]KAF2272842.1 kinase-like protein [Westerdykella ornata]